MNTQNPIVFKGILSLFLCAVLSVSAQTKTKSFKETFSVNKDVVLDINTSHTDIEFDTWNKNQVVVEALIELEGATDEEAEAYFEKARFDITGNANEVNIRSSSGRWSFDFAPMLAEMQELEIVIPEIPEMEFMFEDLAIPELAPLPEMADIPPMPPMPIQEFDYDAYKKDGEKYMKKWQEEFEKEFDAEYRQRMEEWAKRVEERFKERMERFEERKAEREALQNERRERLDEAREAREKAMTERREVLEERRKARQEAMLAKERASSKFYNFGNGAPRNYKVKKTIRIKMPKSARLKMNVRHGEVKLADRTHNMQADLAYARLLATGIDGKETSVRAAYTPVLVEEWDSGYLSTEFSETVDLVNVNQLDLRAISSDVTIDRLKESAMIKNELGNLTINGMADGFSTLTVDLQHGKVVCVLPEVAFKFRVSGRNTSFTPSGDLVTLHEVRGNNPIHEGYKVSEDTNRSIIINGHYSSIILRD